MSGPPAPAGGFWPAPHPPGLLGRPSRKAATAALEAHVEVLEGEPLKAALARALRSAAGLGGQERRFAALAARELSRHQRLLDLAARALGHAPSKVGLVQDQALVRYALWRRLLCGEGWARIGPEVKLPGPLRPRTVHDRLLQELVEGALPEAPLGDAGALERAAARHSFPGWLAERLAARFGEGALDALLGALNAEPAIVLRARPPGAREALREALAAEGVSAEPLEAAPDALRVADAGHRVFETGPYKAGRLQVQDVGSQLIAEACRPPTGSLEGATAADVCAGAGGKTLALADWVGPRGRVLASDRSRRRLEDARDRVRALGLRQVSFPTPLPLAQADVVLVDAPCSGTGSLGREPDQKWKLTPKKVQELTATQAALLDEVARELRPGAVLVYATCSLLPEENEAVVEAFLARTPGFTLEPLAPVLAGRLGEGVAARVCDGPYLRAVPTETPGGGFFAARLRRD